MNRQNRRDRRKLIDIRSIHPLWARIVAGLAAVVMFCTVYSLILPAAAATGDQATEESGFFLAEAANGAEAEEIAGTEDAASSSTEEVAQETATEQTLLNEMVLSPDEKASPPDEMASPPEQEETATKEENGNDASGSAESGTGEFVMSGDSRSTDEKSAAVTQGTSGETADEAGEKPFSETTDETIEETVEELPETEDCVSSEEVPEICTVESVDEDSESEKSAVSEESSLEEEPVVYEAGSLEAYGDAWEIVVTYEPEAEIPDDARLEVEEILAEDERYQDYCRQSLEEAGVSSPAEIQETDAAEETDGPAKKAASDYVRIFNIEIRADGQKVEPAADVTVNIRLLDPPEETDAAPQVVHFAEGGAELMELKEQTENEEDEGIQFVTDEFSVYSVVYTVDFRYEVDGKIFSFSMQGADSVSLRSLIEELHVYESEDLPATELDEFMEAIETVSFSDTDLLVPVKVTEDTTVGQIRTELKLYPTYPLGLDQSEVIALNEKEYTAGDWVLISMKAFDTEETLTITMNTGESFDILVTDAQDAQMVGDQVLTVSNPAGTTIDLFDYWIVSQGLVGRDGWGDLNQSWGGHDDSEGLNGTGNNKGINASGSDTEHGHALKFSPAWEGTVFNGTKNNWTSLNTNGRDGLNSYTGSGDPFRGIVQGLLVNGYPALTENDTIGSNGESLAYLFDPSVSHDGKQNYPGVDQLLYVDKDGYYTYDSRDYKADFGDGTFVLTEQTSDDGEIRGFWPFGTQNFWTGMHINTQFSMPVNGQVLNPKGEYKEMQFEFSGDDDTWLYIDGVLVGDGGGIHNRTEIDVNFADGTVTVTGKNAGGHSGDFEETKYLDDIFKAAGKYNDDDWEDIGDGSGHKRFKAGTYHTFDMFYLERGGGESNLYIHYNLISTADFTAHKSYEGYDEDDILQRNQFRFALIGLDGKYRSVWSEDAGDYILVQEDTTSKAIMPHASDSGAGTTVSPYYDGNTVTELSDSTSVGSQTYITGNVEDGNVNFGTAEISEQDMHECDEGNPPVYRYIVHEIVPDDAVNADNVTWAEATPEQRAAGGFVKDSVIYDGTPYYMSARVTKWTETDAAGREIIRYGLSKTYYTDDTYTEKKPDTSFIDFRNRYTPDIADLEFDKVNAKREPVEGAVFQLFRDSACKIPAKDADNQNITATSDAAGKVSFIDVRTGIYFLKEISVPEPYEVNHTVYRARISKQGSSMSVNADQDNHPVTEVINIKPDDITVMKKWYDAEGEEMSGEGYPATVQLRRYKYVRTGPEPETHNVILHFHFPDASWLPSPNDKDFGPFEITGNSVVITWTVGGCNFFWDSAYTDKITDGTGANLLQIPLDRELALDIYGDQNWASGNLNLVSVSGAYDDSKEYRIDEAFPSAEESEKATKTLTSDSYMYAWSLGTGEGYDFPIGNELGDYLYYVVELDENGNAVEIEGETGNGMELVSIKYDPEKTEGRGITHGIVTVANRIPGPPSIDIVIKKTDDEPDSTNYLDGAVFKLQYKEDPSSQVWQNAKDCVNIPELDQNSRFTVRDGETGITLTGLLDGQYRIQEITPPEGYVVTQAYPVMFTVRDGEILDTDGTINEVRYVPAADSQPAEFIIPNTPGVELPSTGGPGTRLFTILGLAMMLGAAVMLFRRRRLI